MEEKSPWRKVIAVATAILLFSAGYLWLRRFGTPFLEVYIKLLFPAVAVTGTALLSISFLLGPMARFWPSRFVPLLPLRKHYGLAGFFLIAFHVIWGLVRISPANYSRYFDASGALTPVAELSMFLGVLGFMIFTIVALTSLPSIIERLLRDEWKIFQRLGYLALFFGLLHFTLIKWKGWLAFDSWPFYLPTLSFLLFVFIVFVFVMRLLAIIFPQKPQE